MPSSTARSSSSLLMVLYLLSGAGGDVGNSVDDAGERLDDVHDRDRTERVAQAVELHHLGPADDGAEEVVSGRHRELTRRRAGGGGDADRGARAVDGGVEVLDRDGPGSAQRDGG